MALTYAEYCAKACPDGCGKGLPRYQTAVGDKEFHAPLYVRFECTAPDREAYEADLRAEIERLRKAIEGAACANDCASVNGCWCNVCGEDHTTDGRPVCEGFTNWLDKPCNCWKAEVLK